MSKGDKGGKCNRTVCTNTNAQYYNHSTRKYYCEACAVDLNCYNKKEALELYGHDLCTLDADDSEKQKLIEQAQRIIDSGCSHIKNCQSECLLNKFEICRAERLFDYDDGQHVAYGFLAGIAFEKGDL